MATACRLSNWWAWSEATTFAQPHRKSSKTQRIRVQPSLELLSRAASLSRSRFLLVRVCRIGCRQSITTVALSMADRGWSLALTPLLDQQVHPLGAAERRKAQDATLIMPLLAPRTDRSLSRMRKIRFSAIVSHSPLRFAHPPRCWFFFIVFSWSPLSSRDSSDFGHWLRVPRPNASRPLLLALAAAAKRTEALMIGPHQRLTFCLGPGHLQNLQHHPTPSVDAIRLHKQSWGSTVCSISNSSSFSGEFWCQLTWLMLVKLFCRHSCKSLSRSLSAALRVCQRCGPQM